MYMYVVRIQCGEERQVRWQGNNCFERRREGIRNVM